jgi:hypothetical protein
MFFVLYCATATLSGIWPKNVAWTWKHGPQLSIYYKGYHPASTQETKEGQQSPNINSFKEPKHRIQGINSASLCCLAGRYDNPIPTRFLAPRDCCKITEQKIYKNAADIHLSSNFKVKGKLTNAVVSV